MPSREQWEELIEGYGGRLAKAVTKGTSAVIVGEEPGETKIAAAVQKGIPIISYPMFVYLGFEEERGEYQFEHIPIEIVTSLAINLAFAAELVYAKAIAFQSRRHFGIFLQLAAGVEGLLHAAFGCACDDDTTESGPGDFAFEGADETGTEPDDYISSDGECDVEPGDGGE